MWSATIVKVVRRSLCLLVLAGLFAAPAVSAGPTIPAGPAALAELAVNAEPLARPWEGTLDTSFDPGTGADGSVDAIAIQPDGRILIAGQFNSVRDTIRTKLARLMPNGALDMSFTSLLDSTAGPRLYAVALQNDKVLIAGSFTSYDGAPRGGIARLNGDGSLDGTFNALGAGAEGGNILAMLVEPGGEIMIAGDFSTYNGYDRPYIARLHADGTLDTTFNASPDLSYPCPDDRIHSLAFQPSDGKILIGGYFNKCGTVDRQHIARLDAKGEMDTSFDPGKTAGMYDIVYALLAQDDGKVLVGGNFETWGTLNRGGIVRLNADGTPDSSFDPGGTGSGTVLDIFAQPNGKVVIAGGFDAYDGAGRPHLARLRPDGTLDPTFDPGLGTDANPSGIVSAARQPDGKIVIGGDFLSYDGTKRARIARVNGFGRFTSLPYLRR